MTETLAGGEALYLPRLLTARQSAELFERLRAQTRWRQDNIKLYGRAIPVPRLTAWHGEPGASYEYSGLRHEPAPWTPSLRALKARVEEAANAAFNSVLLNLYRDGRDSVDWHSDDEPELGPEPVLASVSLGAERVFQLRRKRGRERLELALAPGSLLIMRGRMQADWEHRVPKTKKPVGARINLTFRLVRG